MKSCKKFLCRVVAFALVLLCFFSLLGNARAAETDSIKGDIDGNGVVNINDAVYLLLHVLFGEINFPLDNPTAIPGGTVFGEAPPVVGNTYKFAVIQGKLGKTLYFNGEMNGLYFACTDNLAEAVDVTIERVGDGVRFYFMDGENKLYIDINEYEEGKAGVRITAEPTAVFVWNEECKVYTAEVAGTHRWLGTYGTYDTISASSIKYIAGQNVSKIGITNFPAGFGIVEPTT